MFRFKHLTAAAAAVAMAATPVAASAANPAASLSVARASTATTGDSRIAEGRTATLVNLGIFAALVAGILLIATTGDDDSPDSP